MKKNRKTTDGSRYATLKPDRITAQNKLPKDEPKGAKEVGGDLRAKRG